MSRLWGLLVLLLVGCGSPPAASYWVLVSQAGSSTIAVVDPVQGQVVKRITVGGLPHRMLLSPDGKKIYAVLVGSQAIAEIDALSLELTRTFLTAPVPEKRDDGSIIQPHFVQNAFAQTTCFACHHPNGAKPFIVGDRPVGISFSSDGHKLWVSHIRKSRLSQIDLASGKLEQTLSLPPSGKAVELADLARLNNRLVIAMRPGQPSTEAGVVRWLDESTLSVVGETPTGSDPSFVLPLEAQGSVLVSNFESNTLSEFGPNQLHSSFTVAPGPLGSRLLPDGRVLALNYYSNSVSLVNLQTAEAQTFKLELNGQTFVNPTHAALSPDGRTAYIVSSGTDAHLLRLELASQKVTRAIPVDGLSFDVLVVPR